MTFIEIAQLDLNAMTKQQLKSYVKLAREDWGKWIDLRKANIVDLQQYLQDFQAWKAREPVTEQEAIEIPEVEADVTEFQELPDFENERIKDIEAGKWYPHCYIRDKALLVAQLHYTQQVADIHQRALLMACAEGQALCFSPDLGQEIYWLWVEGMDASDPRNYWLDSWYENLGTKYQINPLVVKQLFESVRLIIVRYDALIDQIPKKRRE